MDRRKSTSRYIRLILPIFNHQQLNGLKPETFDKNGAVNSKYLSSYNCFVTSSQEFVT